MNNLAGKELEAVRKVERRTPTAKVMRDILDLLSEGRCMTTVEICAALKYSSSRINQVMLEYRCDVGQGTPKSIRIAGYLPNRADGRYVGRGVPQYQVSAKPDLNPAMSTDRESREDRMSRLSSKKEADRDLAKTLALLREQAGNVFKVHFVWMGVAG